MNCLNCSTKVIGHYCQECGQKTEDLRYTLKGLVKDLFFSAFHLEKKGLPNTVKRLTTEPGHAIREVLQGQRLSLYPPFKYLVLVGTLVIIFSLRYRFFHNEYTQVQSNDMHQLPDWIYIPAMYQGFVEGFFKFAEDQATLLNIAAIPIFAFFSFAWLSRGKFNFAENLILNTYITAQQLFFLLLLVPFFELQSAYRPLLIGIYSVAVIAYNVWAYVQFFGRGLSALARAVAVVVVAYLYQFPLNFFIFYIYERYLHHHMNWIPGVYENIVQ
ncbi:MAG TPA: DUF3667 domain-containing protein [Chryseosolibacter sp.]